MLKPITVSVIVPTYNSSKSIEEAIDSVLTQQGINEYFNLELIIIDDCSTDGTCEILKRKGIPYQSTLVNSGGPNKGRNMGLRSASGDYICFLDHDDVWSPNRIIEQMKFMTDAPVVTCGLEVSYEDKNTTMQVSGKSTKGFMHYKENETFLGLLKRSKKGQKIYFGNLMIDASLKEILFEENFGAHDYDWLLRIFENRASIEICQVLFTRVVNKTNLSRSEKYRRNDFYFSLLSLEAYRKKYPIEFKVGYKRFHAIRAKYYYAQGDMKLARFYFIRSKITLKNLAYYLTTWFGQRWVNKKFDVFN